MAEVEYQKSECKFDMKFDRDDNVPVRMHYDPATSHLLPSPGLNFILSNVWTISKYLLNGWHSNQPPAKLDL